MFNHFKHVHCTYRKWRFEYQRMPKGQRCLSLCPVHHNLGNYGSWPEIVLIVTKNICIIQGRWHLYCRFASCVRGFTSHSQTTCHVLWPWTVADAEQSQQPPSCTYLNVSLSLCSPAQQNQWVRKLKAKAVVCRNPHTTNPDLYCFPLLTSLFLFARSSSLCVFLALPSQLSLIACEVINGFHLTSSTILRRAPTNKTRARLTNCASEEP